MLFLMDLVVAELLIQAPVSHEVPSVCPYCQMDLLLPTVLYSDSAQRQLRACLTISAI